MKNIKFSNLIITVSLVLICFSCSTSKKQSYLEGSLNDNGKNSDIQKWHLSKESSLDSTCSGLMQQRYSLDSLRDARYIVQDCTPLDELKLVAEVVDKKMKTYTTPVFTIRKKIETIKKDSNKKDTLTFVVLIKEPAHELTSVTTYHVIVGCYKANTRAQQHLSELKAEGHKEAKILISKHGLNRVSIKAFLEKALAQKFANKYRPIRNDVWVYTLKNSK